MKRSELIHAYNITNPTQAQKDKMLNAILAEAPISYAGKTQKREFRAKQTETRRWSWIPAAAMLILVLCAGGMFLFRTGEEVPSLSSDTTEPVREEYSLTQVEAFQAGQEWADYLRECEGTMEEDGTDILYPYSNWGCVNQAMVEKLDEICKEHVLSFRDQDERYTDSLSYLLEEVDIQNVLNGNASHETGTCAWWDDGSFYFEGTVSLNQADSDWVYPINYVFHRSNPKIFLYEYVEVASAGIYDCWKYTNGAGIELVLALGEDVALVFAEGQENIIYVEVSNSRVGDIQYGEMKMDRDDLEAFAETFDFSLEVRAVYADGEKAGDYDTLLEKYKTALTENWDATACMQADISPLILAEPELVGWCYVDLGSDGTEELVITNGEMVFDLYTIMSDGMPGHLLSSTEESFYGLCENGTIQKQTVLGTTTYWLFYNLVDGISLIPEKAVVWSLEEAQYYAGPTEVDVEPISKGEAGEILVREYANARVAVTYFDNKAEALEQYREILDVYVTALEEKWNPATCSEKGISILISNYVETPEQIGYGFMDIDMNGNLELIMTDGNAILDLYALTKDGPELVISGWERNTYYLHDGFAIFNHASNSASSTTYNICHLVDGSLLTEQRIIFDATEDPDNPWFHQLEGDKVTPITEEEAREIMESFASLTIDFTPMTEYSMWGMSDQTR